MNFSSALIRHTNKRSRYDKLINLRMSDVTMANINLKYATHFFLNSSLFTLVGNFSPWLILTTTLILTLTITTFHFIEQRTKVGNRKVKNTMYLERT